MADESAPPRPPEAPSGPEEEKTSAAAPAQPGAPADQAAAVRSHPLPEQRGEGERAPRPETMVLRQPLYRESRGYQLRLDPPDLSRLRELPGSRGKTEQELAEEFFDAQAERLAAALSEDVPAPAEVRVVVDPFSRQAFLAVGKEIKAILSF